MSRLQFQEIDLSEDEDERKGKNAMIEKKSAAPKPISTLPPTFATSKPKLTSYDLYGITSNDNNISSKTAQSSSFIQKDYDITTPEYEPMEFNAETELPPCDIDSIFESIGTYNSSGFVEEKSIDIDEKELAAPEQPKPLQLTRPVSSFLSKFLTEKRAYSIVEPVIDLDISNDMYLREFCEEFKGEPIIIESESEDEEQVNASTRNELSSKRNVSFKTTQKKRRDGDNDDEEEVEEEPLLDEITGKPKWAIIHVFNLPYEITANQVQYI